MGDLWSITAAPIVFFSKEISHGATGTGENTGHADSDAVKDSFFLSHITAMVPLP